MNSREFARRRKNLMQMMGEGGIAILPAAPVRTRSRDVEYRYRQDSDFYYLTGFAEPEAVAVLAPGRDSGQAHVEAADRADAHSPRIHPIIPMPSYRAGRAGCAMPLRRPLGEPHTVVEQAFATESTRFGGGATPAHAGHSGVQGYALAGRHEGAGCRCQATRSHRP